MTTGLWRPPRANAYAGGRSGVRPSHAERLAAGARGVAASWAFVAAVGMLLAADVVAAWRSGKAGPTDVPVLVLLAVAVVQLSLVLRTSRHAETTASEVARYEHESDQRRAAAAEELRDEVERLRADLARLAARLEIASQGDPKRRSR